MKGCGDDDAVAGLWNVIREPSKGVDLSSGSVRCVLEKGERMLSIFS